MPCTVTADSDRPVRTAAPEEPQTRSSGEKVVHRPSWRERATLRTPVICWNVAPWAT